MDSRNPQEHSVRAGTEMRNNPNVPEIPVSQIYMHPKYNTRTFDHDAALYRLSRGIGINGWTKRAA